MSTPKYKKNPPIPPSMRDRALLGTASPPLPVCIQKRKYIVDERPPASVRREPPEFVWVHWCETCGQPIIAELTPESAIVSCPTCPIMRGRVVESRYVLSAFQKPKRAKRKP